METDKYNVLFFDTPEGEEDRVKVVTDVVAGRTLEMPRPLRIPLRGFALEGADWPVYSIDRHWFVMGDGTDGIVSLFDGFYTAVFDGNTFESQYTRIEGITEGEFIVTITKGQPVWEEAENDAIADDSEEIVRETAEIKGNDRT